MDINFDYSKEKIFNDVIKYLKGEIVLEKEIERYSLNSLANIKIKEELAFKQAYDAYQKIKKDSKKEAFLTSKFLQKFKQWQICYAMEVIMTVIKDYLKDEYVLDAKVLEKYKNNAKSYKLILMGLQVSALGFSLYKSMCFRCNEKRVKIEGYNSRFEVNDLAPKFFLP